MVFDSGFSRHMTGENGFLKGYQIVLKGHVSFGDGEKSRVLEKGTLDVDGLRKLKNVQHVEGIKTNLISISQLCDQRLVVKFKKDTCKMLNKFEKVLEGSRSSDNHYKLLQPHTCHTITLDNIEIWHQKWGHLNFENLTKIVNVGVVHGIPKLGKKEPRICGPCQVGKQLKRSNKMLQ